MRRNEGHVVGLFVLMLGITEETATTIASRMDQDCLNAIAWESNIYSLNTLEPLEANHENLDH